MAVARRRVLYIPGYDPIPPRRYRELYRREGAEQARIAGYALTLGARRDRGGFGWGVTGVFPDATPDTTEGETAGRSRHGGTESSKTAAGGDGEARTRGEAGACGCSCRPAPDGAPGTGRNVDAAPARACQGMPAEGGPSAASTMDAGHGENPGATAGIAQDRNGTSPAPTDSHAPAVATDRERRQAAGQRMAAATPRQAGTDAPPASAAPARRVETEIEVLVWSDVVAASMGRSILATYGQLLRTAWIYIVSGALVAMMRLRRGPVLAALYPVAVLLVQALLAAVAATAAGWATTRLAPWWVALAPAAVAFVAVLIGCKRLDGRLFAHYLMHDYAFTARLRGAYPPELEARITRFADRLAETLADDWDEVLVVGHSSGAYLAVSVLAELTRRESPDPRLALLTLGHVVPMAAFLPQARRLRGDLATVSASPIPWVDVTAPGDACSFGLCDPVATSGVEPETRNGPLVLSAAFSQTLSPQRLRALRHRWFRLHFQYLCAFDHPESYDYFAITAGPLTLAERFAGRRHSPGRITRAVSPYRDRAA